MEWVVADVGGGGRRVGVPDDLVLPLIEALDVPRGTFPIDPYRDQRLGPERLDPLVERLRSAAAARRASIRETVRHRLRLRQWEAWADATRVSAEREDPLLLLLEEIGVLCARAGAEGAAVMIYGD